ncbi:hypothetical protein BCIN_11g00450 [Botrytis cinerea B05.10]|uniref:Uncharacterized protein n=1 Tax=Botryotinia fuckeliana (strain B05.10) TaxID=332648 RepID=A0A384JVY3_BOTFB|nr:hypothetical protein BCIN_11g00450 [Botrytis cinerea B05.10]ATZ54698.1 hypothetical protein BCIN_11g00450 [Botrytis cinerea B05.10]
MKDLSHSIPHSSFFLNTVSPFLQNSIYRYVKGPTIHFLLPHHSDSRGSYLATTSLPTTTISLQLPERNTNCVRILSVIAYSIV